MSPSQLPLHHPPAPPSHLRPPAPNLWADGRRGLCDVGGAKQAGAWAQWDVSKPKCEQQRDILKDSRQSTLS